MNSNSNRTSTSSPSNHNTSLNGSMINGDTNTIHEEDDEEKKSSRSPGTPSPPNGKLVNNSKQQQPQLVYRFGISSIVEKKEALLAGDKVYSGLSMKY